MKGIVDPIYVKTEENMSDLLTKNVSRELFERHSLKLVEDIPPEYLVNKLREGADEYGWMKAKEKYPALTDIFGKNTSLGEYLQVYFSSK